MSFILTETRNCPPNVVQSFSFAEMNYDDDGTGDFFVEDWQISVGTDDIPGKTTSIEVFIGTVHLVDSGANPSVFELMVHNGVSPGNGKIFAANFNPGSVGYVNGFWQPNNFTVLVNQSPSPAVPVTIDVSIQCFTVSRDFFAGDGNHDPNPPTNGERVDGEDDVDLSWDDNSSNELGFLIDRDDGLAFFVAADVTTFNDPSGAGHSYEVSSFYGDGTAISGISDPLVIAGPEITYVGLLGFSIDTDAELSFVTDIITIVGNITIDVSTSAELIYLVNPSGVYTLVENQLHDILYERGGVITTQELKIPDPYFITGFAGD